MPEGGTTFQPNPSSVVQSDRGINHLDYFRFVGRVVGKVRACTHLSWAMHGTACTQGPWSGMADLCARKWDSL